MASALSFAILASGAVYLALVLAFWTGLRRLRPGRNPRVESVTLVVPAHNESDVIDACLGALAAQDYPSEQLEIIVVDDRSNDDTAARARLWAARIPGLRVLSTNRQTHRCPKKNALETGIRAGSGDLILTTDADCVPPAGWVRSTVRAFEPDTGMVIGHAPLRPSGGLLQDLLALQGLIVSALAAGSAGIGWPLTCSGRNLAYRRRAFEDAGGFNAIGHILGGDDVLLMRRIFTHTAWKTRFNPDPGSAVPSRPHTDALLRRQIRYQSKAVHTGIQVLIPALFIYIFHLLLLAGPLIIWTYPQTGPVFAGILTARIAADGLFLLSAAGRFNVRLRWFPLLELIAAPYIVSVCALGALKFIPHRWK